MKQEIEGKPFTVRLPKKLKTKAQKRAREEKRSLNAQIAHVLELYENGEMAKEKAVAA